MWLMRQAGRYLPEYRALRQQVTFLEACRDVERAVEISLQPVSAVGTEAVIFFSDIFVPVEGMGVALDFAPGPVIEEPIRRAEQVAALSLRDPRETVPYVYAILRRLRAELEPKGLPLLGFAGAPFTLACYLVRGRGDPERRYDEVRALMRDEPELMRALLARLAEMTVAYLNAQIEAGAQAVQLFDTWAGLLSEDEYRDWILPGVKAIAAGLDRAAAPFILFASDAPHLTEVMAESGCDVLSLGASVDLAAAARGIGQRVSLQGNFDPADLARPADEIATRVHAIAAAAAPARGHIMNLGHGGTPDPPGAGVRAFIEATRALAPR